MNLYLIITIFILIECHGTIAMVRVSNTPRLNTCIVCIPTGSFTYNWLVIGIRSPTCILTIEEYRTNKLIMRLIWFQVKLPSIIQLLLNKLHILCHRNRTDSQCLIYRSRSTTIRITVEAVAQSKLFVSWIDRTREIETIDALTGNGLLGTRTCRWQEDGITVRTCKFVTSYTCLLYPFFLTLIKQLFKLFYCWHCQPRTISLVGNITISLIYISRSIIFH